MNETNSNGKTAGRNGAEARETIEGLHLLSSVVSAATKHAGAAAISGEQLNGIQAFELGLKSIPLTRKQMMGLWAMFTMAALVTKRAFEGTYQVPDEEHRP